MASHGARRRLRMLIGQRGIPPLASMLDGQRSSLSRRSLASIQAGTFRYEFAGVPCFKNPFDLALYVLLMGRLRPRTIIEIGSAAGGSALWFGAQARALELSARIYSIDINPVTTVSDQDVTFMRGDVHALDDCGLSEVLDSCDRPLLVIEDGPHTYEGCLAALRFFHPYLRDGEYIIVEDGIVKSLKMKAWANGPNRAVDTFLEEHRDQYVIDREYCDFYGYNVTWNTNGYLRRLPSAPR